MRYGMPPIAERLAALQAEGCDRILIFPLYPQYSAATTASVYDKSFAALKTMRWQPAIRTVPPYYDHPAYIAALAASLRSHIDSLDWTPDCILASFHGLPQASLDKGDPYHCHCQKTARLLGEAMELGPGPPADHLPVAVRPGRMAEALRGRDRGRACQGAAPATW